MDNIVLVSGGFDPLHSGHIKLIQDASNHGMVVILLNSDKWLINKKGKFFLPFEERKTIMLALRNIIDVIDFNDDDKSCIDGIKKAISKYPSHKIKFANDEIVILALYLCISFCIQGLFCLLLVL